MVVVRCWQRSAKSGPEAPARTQVSVAQSSYERIYGNGDDLLGFEHANGHLVRGFVYIERYISMRCFWYKEIYCYNRHSFCQPDVPT